MIGLYKLITAVLGSGIIIFAVNYFTKVGKNRNQIKNNKKRIKYLNECKVDQNQVENRLDNILQITQSIQQDIKKLEKNTKANSQDISKIKGILSQMNGNIKDSNNGNENDEDEYPKW